MYSALLRRCDAYVVAAKVHHVRMVYRCDINCDSGCRAAMNHDHVFVIVLLASLALAVAITVKSFVEVMGWL